MNKKNKRKVEIVVKVGILIVAFIGMIFVGIKIGKNVKKNSSPELSTYTYDYEYVDNSVRKADKNIKKKFPKVTEKNKDDYIKAIKDEFQKAKDNKKIKNYEMREDLVILTLKDGSTYYYQGLNHSEPTETIVPVEETTKEK